ncbi:MAG: PAS domain S-box-containing protein [Planctomycetota bacterium]
MNGKSHLDQAADPRPGLAQNPFSGYIKRSSDIYTVVDEQGRFVFVNPAAETYLGLAPDECINRSAFDFVHEDDRVRSTEAFAEWLADPSLSVFKHENRQVNAKTGDIFHMRWTVIGLPDEDGVVRHFASNARDVSDLRKIELELSESDLRLRTLMSGMLDGVITIDPVGDILEASDSCFGIFGYQPSELCGTNIRRLMPEPHLSAHDSYLENYRRTGKTHILNSTREFEVVHKDGHHLVCELSVARIDVPGKEEPFFCGSFRDVTARKTAEESLRESERRFHAVFDQEFQYVGLLRTDGILLDVNQAALASGNVTRADVIGKPFIDTAWWSTSAADRKRLQESIERAAKGEFVRFEAEYVLASGEFHAVDFSLKPILNEGEQSPQLLIAEGRDITEIRQAQKRETSMLRALATIGESASLLAHEIKNPITAVNSALRAVSDLLGEDQQEVLDDLVTRMRHLEHLMRRTLSLAKAHNLRLISVTVRSLFDNVVASLREEFEATNSTISISVADGTPLVMTDVILIEEVVTNLVKNALEAAEYGGEVHLTAKPDRDEMVMIAVEDNGPGVEESIRESLFQPFVTTKSSGTGIGLALSKKIVEEHGGSISVEPCELGGASFRFSLPVATK